MTSTDKIAAPTTTTLPTVWPCLGFRDARAAADFFTTALGFELTAMYTSDDDPSVVLHAELRWPLGGGIMFGSAGGGELPDRKEPGTDSLYVVCTDPDALYERAKGAGAETVHGPSDKDYGSRDFTVADPEGNYWTFGTYRGQ